MRIHDLSQNRKLERLTQLTQELGESRTMEQTLTSLHRAFAEVDGFVASLLISTVGLPTGHYRVLRTVLEKDSPDVAETEAPAVQSGGTLASLIAQPGQQLIDDVDWTPDPYFREKLRGYSSAMAIPLAGERLPITWAILLKKSPQRFSVADLEEAVARVAVIGALLENQLLAAELKRAHQRIDDDARRVGEIQRALLPASLPRIAGLEIAASYKPSGRASGDLYDFFPLDENRWCAFIGDAAGHGLAAAVVMAIVQTVLRLHPDGVAGPASLLTHANRQLCAKGIGGFFTAFLAIYEPVSRRWTYANAGHPPPLLRRSSDGSVVPLDAVLSYPLGIDDTETFNETTAVLEPGDTILLYTDGIIESLNPQHEMFDLDRLAQTLREASDRPADLVNRLVAAVGNHEHGQPAIDDQTLVAARVLQETSNE